MPADPIMVEIEKGIPISIAHQHHSKYPWRKLEVGESFCIPFNASVQSSAATYAKRLGVAFTTRTVMKNGERWLRVWRTA